MLLDVPIRLRIAAPGIASVAWRLLSNLRALGTERTSHDKEHQSRKEPGRQANCSNRKTEN